MFEILQMHEKLGKWAKAVNNEQMVNFRKFIKLDYIKNCEEI